MYEHKGDFSPIDFMRCNLNMCCTFLFSGAFGLSPLTWWKRHPLMWWKDLKMSTPSASNDQLSNHPDETDIYKTMNSVGSDHHPFHKVQKKSYFDYFDAIQQIQRLLSKKKMILHDLKMKGLQLPKYQIDHKKGKEQILNKEMNTKERQRLRSVRLLI